MSRRTAIAVVIALAWTAAILWLANELATPRVSYTRFFAVVCLAGLALIALYTRRRLRIHRERGERACPRCGRGVAVGAMECPACQFDFWTVGAR